MDCTSFVSDGPTSQILAKGLRAAVVEYESYVTRGVMLEGVNWDFGGWHGFEQADSMG
jgi:hypothetical protein